jgi:hypothetical protein
MRQKSGPEKQPEDAIRDIRRATGRHFSAEEKIRVVLEGLRWRRASPNSVAARASPRRCTMAGRKSSWRLARGDSPARDCGRREPRAVRADRTAMLLAMPSINRGQRAIREDFNIRSLRYFREPAQCRNKRCRVGRPRGRCLDRQCESSRPDQADDFVSVVCR